MIYTASFFTYPRETGIPVSLALYHPDWYTGRAIPPLAPYHFMIKNITEQAYKKTYARILSKVSPNSVIDYLNSISSETQKDVFLLCWCLPWKFCHRHLVAEWLSKAGLSISEYES